jgi:aspartyl-tRNA(Asn)/glutamyl-tRNA(Gln) amidotransferase subunit C
MAKLSRDDVLELAKLSRLKLTEAEVSKFIDEIDEILGYVEQLQKVDLASYEPTDQVTGLTDVMRADQPVDYQAKPAQLLKNLPASEKGYIKVRRVIE